MSRHGPGGYLQVAARLAGRAGEHQQRRARLHGAIRRLASTGNGPRGATMRLLNSKRALPGYAKASELGPQPAVAPIAVRRIGRVVCSAGSYRSPRTASPKAARWLSADHLGAAVHAGGDANNLSSATVRSSACCSAVRLATFEQAGDVKQVGCSASRKTQPHHQNADVVANWPRLTSRGGHRHLSACAPVTTNPVCPASVCIQNQP